MVGPRDGGMETSASRGSLRMAVLEEAFWEAGAKAAAPVAAAARRAKESFMVVECRMTVRDFHWKVFRFVARSSECFSLSLSLLVVAERMMDVLFD